jgi:hypothetical protein
MEGTNVRTGENKSKKREKREAEGKFVIFVTKTILSLTFVP